MSETTVGLLYPGEMGAAVGQCLTAAGHRVLWVPEGRSRASAARGAAAGLTAATGGLAGLVREADVIVSVVPPHAALGLARQVAGVGGVYVDAKRGLAGYRAGDRHDRRGRRGRLRGRRDHRDAPGGARLHPAVPVR